MLYVKVTKKINSNILNNQKSLNFEKVNLRNENNFCVWNDKDIGYISNDWLKQSLDSIKEFQCEWCELFEQRNYHPGLKFGLAWINDQKRRVESGYWLWWL